MATSIHQMNVNCQTKLTYLFLGHQANPVKSVSILRLCPVPGVVEACLGPEQTTPHCGPLQKLRKPLLFYVEKVTYLTLTLLRMIMICTDCIFSSVSVQVKITVQFLKTLGIFSK